MKTIINHLKQITTHKWKLIYSISLLATLTIFSCEKDQSIQSNPIPYVTVNRTINLNLPQYSALNTKGNAIYLTDIGYKGITVVRDYSDNLWALDMACPFHKDADCSHVIQEKSGLAYVCGSYNSANVLLPCCASRYSLDGTLLDGPSTFPLRRYNLQKNGSELLISN
ncbi:MAG: hypothetical protein SGJ04_06695 [Bacteroidota bacterium]|nr:hypothetical protein [Bacteroidota bacterium]